MRSLADIREALSLSRKSMKPHGQPKAVRPWPSVPAYVFLKELVRRELGGPAQARHGAHRRQAGDIKGQRRANASRSCEERLIEPAVDPVPGRVDGQYHRVTEAGLRKAEEQRDVMLAIIEQAELAQQGKRR